MLLFIILFLNYIYKYYILKSARQGERKNARRKLSRRGREHGE